MAASTATITLRLVPLEVPRPHAAQHSHLCQRCDVRRCARTAQGVQQHEAVRPDLGGVGFALGRGVGQAHVLDPAVVALVPVRERDGAQPVRCSNGDGVQRHPQRLAHQLQPVQGPHGGEHMRAVRALAPSGLQQPTLAGGVQQAGQQPLRGCVLEQAPVELAQDREVEAGVGQVEGEQIFPVDPAPDGVGRLAVAQALAELHEGHQGKAPGRVGRLAELGVEVRKVRVREHGPELVPQEHIRVAAPERGARDAGGVVGDQRERLRGEQHGRPPRWETDQTPPPGQGSGLRQQCLVV